MKIQINFPDLILAVLDKGYQLGREGILQEDEYKKDDDLEELRKISGIRYPTIEMPSPLKSAGFMAKRTPYSYCAVVSLYARGPAFFNKSPCLERKVKEAGKGDSFFQY